MIRAPANFKIFRRFFQPVKVTDPKGKWMTLTPKSEWQTMQVYKLDPDKFRVAEDQFYIETQIRRMYIDPKRTN